MLPKPHIDIRGRNVIISTGPEVQTIQAGSHEEAIEIAAEQEAHWERVIASRREAYDRNLAAGVPQVLLHPDDAEPVAPEPVDSEPSEPEEPGEPEPVGELVSVVGWRWEPGSERMVVELTAAADVTLWRSMGDRSSTVELGATAGPVSRAYKGRAGDRFVLRVGGEDGAVLIDTEVPS
jgi:hypothetical protein